MIVSEPPVPAVGEKPKPKPRLSLLLTTENLCLPKYENLQNGFSPFANPIGKAPPDSSANRVVPPKPKPRRRSLLDAPLLQADTFTTAELAVEKDFLNSCFQNPDEELQFSVSLARETEYFVSAFSNVVNIEDKIYDNINNNISSSTVCDGPNNLGDSVNSHCLPVDVNQEESEIDLELNLNAQNTISQECSRIEDSLTETSLDSETSVPLNFTDERPIDVVIQPIKCMPYNSPRLSKGPRGGGVTQDGAKKDARPSGLLRASGRGTTSKASEFSSSSYKLNVKENKLGNKDKMNLTENPPSLMRPQISTGKVSSVASTASPSPYVKKRMQRLGSTDEASKESDTSDTSSVSSISSGYSITNPARRRIGSIAKRNVEIRRSAAVPPQTVATLANKFNAMITENQTGTSSTTTKVQVNKITKFTKSCPSSPLRRSPITVSKAQPNKNSNIPTFKQSQRDSKVTVDSSKEKKTERSDSFIRHNVGRNSLNSISSDKEKKSNSLASDFKYPKSEAGNSDNSLRRPSFVKQAILNYEVSISSSSSSSPELQRRNSLGSHVRSSSTIGSLISPNLLKKRLEAKALNSPKQNGTSSLSAVDSVTDSANAKTNPPSDQQAASKISGLMAPSRYSAPQRLISDNSEPRLSDAKKSSSQEKSEKTETDHATSGISTAIFSGRPLRTTGLLNGLKSSGPSSTSTNVVSTTATLSSKTATTSHFQKPVVSNTIALPTSTSPRLFTARKLNFTSFGKAEDNSCSVRTSEEKLSFANKQLNSANKTITHTTAATTSTSVINTTTITTTTTVSTSVISISKGRALFERKLKSVDSSDSSEETSQSVKSRIPPPLPTTQPRQLDNRYRNSASAIQKTSIQSQNPEPKVKDIHSRTDEKQPTCFLHSRLSNSSISKPNLFNDQSLAKESEKSASQELIENSRNTKVTRAEENEKNSLLNSKKDEPSKPSFLYSKTNDSTTASFIHVNAPVVNARVDSKGKSSLDRALEVSKSNYVPNTSFLWRESTLHASQQSDFGSSILNSVPPPPNLAPPPIPTEESDQLSPNGLGYANIYDDIQSPYGDAYEEPLYNEANLRYTSGSNDTDSSGDGPHKVNSYTTSRTLDKNFYNAKAASPRSSAKEEPSSLHDSDEGWVDLSDHETDSDSITKHSSLPVKTRNRNRRTTPKKAMLRRSWSQSLREFNATQEGKIEATDIKLEDESEEYQDFDEFFDSDESSSTNPDHLYEALYEVVNSRYTSTDSVISEEDPKKTDKSNPSVFPCSLEGILEDQDGHEADNKNLPIDPSGEKAKQLKRNWSLTKSDIRLELSSRLNKIRIKKTSNSASDIGLETETSPTQIGNTKNKRPWSFKTKFARKKSGSTSPKRSPSPKKESALFYVQSYVTETTEKEVQDVGAVSNNSETGPELMPRKSSLAGNGNAAKSEVPSTVKSSSPAQPAVSQTNRRRTSAGSNVVRPKTAPPAPPANHPRRRQGSDLALDSFRSECKSFDGKLLSDTEKFLASIDSDLLRDDNSRGRRDSDSESVFSTVRYADIDINQTGTITVSRSNSSVSNDSEFHVITSRGSKTRSSIASTGSGSSSESYIRMEDVDPTLVPSHLSSQTILENYGNDDEIVLRSKNITLSEDSGIYSNKTERDSKLSPFEDEPLYQFYNIAALQRATKMNLECSEDEDDDYEPILGGNNQIQTTMSAMDLIAPTDGGQRTLWGELQVVRESGILEKMTPQKRKLQEAMFEVITSEASYLKSLNVLVDHFMQCRQFIDEFSPDCVLSKNERHVLFSNIHLVRETSEKLLTDLEKRWQENIMLPDICDILYEHASKNFDCYVKYCSNQIYQDRMLKELKENNLQFVEVVRRLEANPICQNLAMHSFLMLPMQRITRLPLLVDAIYHRLEAGTAQYELCKKTYNTISKIVQQCNDGARKMERMEEMLIIDRQLEFRDVKAIPLISSSRWLVKRGELVKLIFPENSSKLTFGRRCSKQLLYLYLFTDLLVITKKKGDTSYQVIDYCQRNMVEVEEINNFDSLPARPPDGCKNLIRLIMLQNSENKTIKIVLSCPLESDRVRWMEAVTPIASDNPDERIYEDWDCPQVQATHIYNAQQPDELSLEESDVINVFKKTSDGWYQGERIRDGVSGWFPANHTFEIISSHVRARNLRQRYRLMEILEEQGKKEKENKSK